MAKKRKTATKRVAPAKKGKVVKTAHMTKGGRVCIRDTEYRKLNNKGDVKITDVKVIRKPTPQIIESVKKSKRKILK